MSLIEEALRKQLEETDKSKGPVRLAPSPSPSSAPAAPPAVPAEPDPARDSEPVRKAWPLLLGMVFGGLVLVIGIAWLLLFGLGMWKGSGAQKKPVKATAKVEPAKVVATAEIAVAVAEVKSTGAVEVVAVATNPPAAVAEPSVAVNPPISTAVPPAVASTTPVAVRPAEATVPEVAAQEPVVTPVATPATDVQPLEKIALPVVWPKLSITGLIGGGRTGRSAAIINKQMVEPGVVLEGVRVEAIEKNGVRLSFQGETRLVVVGGTTE